MAYLSFHGACDSVTGSCYLLTTDSVRVLIDCGLFQGDRDSRERNEESFPFVPSEIDAVLLTHAHIDHSGLLPKLVKEGFRGEIITHGATVDLAEVMLPDSAYIQQMEAEWATRKNKRAGNVVVEPIYTIEDAHKALKLFRRVQYGEQVDLAADLWSVFHNAGHILGSAIIELGITVNGKAERIVFSGDFGIKSRPIVQDPVTLDEADIVVIESTYGNRLHEPAEQKEQRLREILTKAHQDKEKVIVPAFAVGRTQELLYELNKLYHEGKIPLIPIFVDSPLAVSATEIFANNSDLFDEETLKLLRSEQSPFNYPGLTLVRDAAESRALNDMKGPAVIISASGMATAGRIKHHLKHNLWRNTAHVLFVGYQGQGTLGRRIRDGAPIVTIFGEEIAVRANIHAIDGFSAHADQAGLLEWLQAFSRIPRAVFITHGEEDSRREFASLVRQKLNLNAIVPRYADRFDLSRDALVPEETPAPVREDERLAELEGLWREARTLLNDRLCSGSRKNVKDARRLAQKLEEIMREVRNQLSKP